MASPRAPIQIRCSIRDIARHGLARWASELPFVNSRSNQAAESAKSPWTKQRSQEELLQKRLAVGYPGIRAVRIGQAPGCRL
eukprot:1542139-Pyramimonas_sp.AAC.1